MQDVTTLQAELQALRQLEKAIRDCGLPSMMISGQGPLERLSLALQQVMEARAGSGAR
ncbi:hypothetical protein [Noviherbaspirillum galbum]|uniref:Uncharacterized protein n=1 Tax=Noviherbaspirillum galbum TaxID=2709383 RepID=A0A6B3SGB5_9BURK|nr:hypothetical protein [Noviherbaspirillum galbum]NEX59643.1 hypothetical protein [Noviherbaspirillum galbum]